MLPNWQTNFWNVAKTTLIIAQKQLKMLFVEWSNLSCATYYLIIPSAMNCVQPTSKLSHNAWLKFKLSKKSNLECSKLSLHPVFLVRKNGGKVGPLLLIPQSPQG
ncbi:hypothetical protein AL037_08295 [Salipiger aestuarii]|nr:hypothetical protein AL037_08295 [Salipiger aestuarii]